MTTITPELITSFTPSKVFRSHKPETPITCLDYDRSGQFLISSGVDESIHLYDVTRGKHLKPTYSKKYGCHLAKFTRRDNNCVFASTKENDTIRYLSLQDNSFIRYFKGHTAQVTGLEMGDSQDVFVSASLDNTVRLWDPRTPNCQNLLATPYAPNVIALDPLNCVLAIYNSLTTTLQIQSLENFIEEPITSADCSSFLNGIKIVNLEFTNDQKYIILTTSNATEHFIVDAYSLDLVARLKGQLPLVERKFPDTGNLTISPDCRFVIGGNGNGCLLVWDLKPLKLRDESAEVLSLEPVKRIANETKTLPRMVKFNPTSCMLTTADTEVCFWLPKTSE